MKKVYLDNNVYVDIEDNTFKENDFIEKSNFNYFFSSSIIEELLEGEKIPQLNVERRIQLITKICKDNYILPGYDLPEYSKQLPVQVYNNETTDFVRFLRKQINKSVKNINPDHQRILQKLGLKKIEVNNIIPSEIIPVINKSLKAYNMTINDYLIKSNAKGRGIYSALFNLLDAVCYWKDRDNAEVSRLHDASHTYYAQLCDYFVTNDKRLSYKADAIYKYLGINTIVIKTSDFLLLN